MSAIDQLFTEYRAAKKKALMPFITAGDPDLAFTADVVRELDRRGCAMCEVGIPYSDPIADGPVIQASYTRALAKGVKVKGILDSLASVKSEVKFPRVTMVSYAILHRYGLARYIHDAKQAGISGAIVPDLLVEESAAAAKLCQEADFSLIQLITPTTPRDRALRIAATSTGFIYYVSVTGITGERTQLPPDLIENVSWLRSQTPLPICIGFGISTPEHVNLLAPVADGLIVGSAIVRRMATAGEGSRSEVLRGVGDYVSTLLDALHGTTVSA
ncbi:tryptophan synthase, alpha subunit [Pirellula staleyi DSM 6068]|uniref:Tryptophan synthase alpha chain n=1 Tax=Pirellula staleyi (strain ATCC 27377 / DSM 6068 / ICPB 4128) TaxID=530564 RepID=D2R0X9_PIRSD|nr:tryptophan synthase subunit alpha [Pirellula staleyi]ADB18464.1 tryptophan synthase, alpha subunit [Pirellula staleyi DSM 6068]